MLARTLQLLKRNPIILLFYFIYVVITGLIMFLLYPWDMLQNSYNVSEAMNLISIGIAYMKMMLSLFLLTFFGFLFMAGYGYMVSEAMNTGATYASSFVKGIKQFFVRVLLAGLLMMAFAFVFVMVLILLMIPLILLSLSNPLLFTIIFTVFIMVLLAVSMPIVILWYPALIIDNTGVIQGMKYGAKAGLKYYWKLLLVILAMYLPTPLGLINNREQINVILTPSYFAMLIISVLISSITLPLIFVIYKDYREKTLLRYPDNSPNQPCKN